MLREQPSPIGRPTAQSRRLALLFSVLGFSFTVSDNEASTSVGMFFECWLGHAENQKIVTNGALINIQRASQHHPSRDIPRKKRHALEPTLWSPDGMPWAVDYGDDMDNVSF